MMKSVPKCGTGTTSRDRFSNCFLPKDMSRAFEQSHRYEQQYDFLKLCVFLLENYVFILCTYYV